MLQERFSMQFLLRESYAQLSCNRMRIVEWLFFLISTHILSQRRPSNTAHFKNSHNEQEDSPMLEKNTIPQENKDTEDEMFDDDPYIERLCRLMGIDDSTENPGWIRYHLLLMFAFMRGFIVGFRRSSPKTKMMVKEAWSEFKTQMKGIWTERKQ